MNRDHKIALAVLAGVVGSFMLLSTAIAIPVALHGFARMHAGFAADGDYGMMGPRGYTSDDGAGCRRFDDSQRGRGGRGGMMGPRGYERQDGRGYGPGTGACPNLDATGTAL